MFWNIRCVHNAIARWNLRYYDRVEAAGTIVSSELGCDGRCVSPTGSLSLVVSMDRLLRYFLQQFIRRGAMDFTTASGARFSCGDGTVVVERGTIADALLILMDQPEILPRWAKLQWWLRYLVRHFRQFNPRGRSKDNVA